MAGILLDFMERDLSLIGLGTTFLLEVAEVLVSSPVASEFIGGIVGTLDNSCLINL